MHINDVHVDVDADDNGELDCSGCLTLCQTDGAPVSACASPCWISSAPSCLA